MPHSEKDVANIEMIGRLIRAAGRHVAERDPDQLARLVALHRVLDEATVDAVTGQRAAGVYWSTIGEALGVTKQAVIQMYGPEIRARKGA